MDEVKKMLQVVVKGQKSLLSRVDKTDKMLRAIINGQSALKQELLGETKKLEGNINIRFDKLEKKVENNGKRLDKIGKSVAYLEDDAPTRDEHNKLEKRVGKVEQEIASL